MIVFGSDYRTPPGHAEPGTSAQRLLEGGSVAIAVAAAGLRSLGDAGIESIAVVGRRRRHTPPRRSPRRWRPSSGPRSSTSARPRIDLIVVGSQPNASARRITLSGASRTMLNSARGSVLVLPSGAPIRPVARPRGASRGRVSHTFGVAEADLGAGTPTAVGRRTDRAGARRADHGAVRAGPKLIPVQRSGAVRAPARRSCSTSCWTGSRRRSASTRWRSCCTTSSPERAGGAGRQGNRGGGRAGRPDPDRPGLRRAHRGERVAIFIADVDHADILNPILREKGIRSLLGVPLIVEGKLIGVLHVGSLTPRTFGHERSRRCCSSPRRAPRPRSSAPASLAGSSTSTTSRSALQRSLLPKSPGRRAPALASPRATFRPAKRSVATGMT